MVWDLANAREEKRFGTEEKIYIYTKHLRIRANNHKDTF
jgi:hypothetical protein